MIINLITTFDHFNKVKTGLQRDETAFRLRRVKEENTITNASPLVPRQVDIPNKITQGTGWF